MKPILKYTLLGLLVVFLAGVSAAGVAYAQGDDPRGRGVLSELLGLTSEELKAAIEDGKTIQELADEAGVDLEAYRGELQLARQGDLKTRIDEALANGEITQDQADWLLEGLEKGYLDGPIFRFGSGGESDFGGRPGLDRDGLPGTHGRKMNSDQ